MTFKVIVVELHKVTIHDGMWFDDNLKYFYTDSHVLFMNFYYKN